jgi:uncharacterized damage-inducible protein DinB
MEINTVDDIYEANKRVRARLLEVLSNISDEEAGKPIEGQPWTIAQIVQHISMVEEGTSKICSKLLSKAQAEDLRSDGRVVISDNYKKKAQEISVAKVSAPEIVQPKLSRPLSESIAKLAENRKWLESLRALFQQYDGTVRKFPHPFFGEISAQEWLLLAGHHERRHTDQIKRLLLQNKKPGCEEGMQPGNESKQ